MEEIGPKWGPQGNPEILKSGEPLGCHNKEEVVLSGLRAGSGRGDEKEMATGTFTSWDCYRKEAISLVSPFLPPYLRSCLLLAKFFFFPKIKKRERVTECFF